MKATGTILITGASGFIGRNLFSSELFNLYDLKSFSLRKNLVENIDFGNTSCIIHLAGLAQLNKEITIKELYDVNHELTVSLAKKAKSDGVDHFVFLSSTKVFGEAKTIYNIKDVCNPDDDYGKSKLLAENDLWLLNDNSFKITIIRPALVYGLGVKGNLLSMMKLVRLGLPLPFGEVNNARSLTYVGNLIAFIKHVINEGICGTFIVTDGIDISTAELVSQIRTNMELPLRLFKIPKTLSKLLSRLKPGISKRLFGTLCYEVVDDYKSIGFTPLFKPQQGLKIMVDHFVKSRIS